MRKRGWLIAFVVALTVGSCATPPVPHGERDVFLEQSSANKSKQVHALAKADSAVALTSGLVAINPALLAEARSDPSQWKPFNLNVGGTSSIVTTTSFDKPVAGVERWIAEGNDAKFAIMVEQGHGAATIHALDRSFRLYGTPDAKVQRLIEPDERYLVEGDDQVEPPRARSNRVQPNLTLACDADHDILVPPGKGARPRILVLFTPAAQTWLSSQGRQISSEIQLIMSMMQSAMQGRWFAVYPQLASFQMINYTERGPSLRPDLDQITQNRIPNVLQLRNQFAADLVMLIGHYPSAQACGVAWLNHDAASTNTQATGYSVVNVDVNGLSYCDLPVTGVHEVGHNMGMQHDRPNAGSSPFSYNFGHVNVQARARTIMAYSTQCTSKGYSCPAKPIFSSPYQSTGKGEPMGAADANNMEMLCRTAGSIERNR
ncbi:MAG: hypothetical protein E5Y15_28575 [Mesorhizobium sp.]|nr:MAG: hypothetical protein E5Y15_28575 [Mesorhizobium sp.]